MSKKNYQWVVLFALLIGAKSVVALDCGRFEFPHCFGPEDQFAGGFDPDTGYGGFGGGDCVARKPPIIFIHGNGDRAISWDSPIEGAIEDYPPVKRSVYEELKHQGYNDCELFGITYLSPTERNKPQDNFHRRAKYRIINEFLNAVKAYTGHDKVDLVAHSLGVSMTMAALRSAGNWHSVRRFINIAGAIRGLSSCLVVGPANPLALTCGSENFFDRYTFGFYPYYNGWTGPGRTGYSLRRAPQRHAHVDFFTIHAGVHDKIHCPPPSDSSRCTAGPLFEDNANVHAQLNVGVGATESPSEAGDSEPDLPRQEASDFQNIDTDGIGHFKARNNTGEIIYTMLSTECEGLGCKGSYLGGPVAVD